MKTKNLSLDLDTLVELTPAAAQQVNGGFATVSSPMPGPQPTPPVPAPTSSVQHTPPLKHHHHHHHHR